MRPPAILSRLRGVQRTSTGWLAFCPGHDDREKRSLSVALGEDGRTLLHCFTGCPTERVCSAVNMALADLAAPDTSNGRRSERREVATYDYTNERGELLYQVVRFEPKDFRPRRPDGKGGWTWSLGEVRRVIYHLPDLAEHERVYWVEGEKDADRLWGLDLAATTSPSGASSFRDEYARQLAEAAIREVVVIPDHDRPGHTYATAAGRAMQAAGLAVRWLELPDLGEVQDKHGPDVSDWLDAGHTADELLTLAEQAPVFSDAMPTAAPPADSAALETEGDDYRVTWPDALELVAVAPRESGEGIHAGVTVRLNDSVVSWGRLNLVSTSMREGLVKKLRETEPGLPWRDRLKLACRLIVERVRVGAPFVALCPAPRPAGRRDLVEDVLPVGETSLIYADGDTGKGWVALLIAVALATGQAFPNLRPARRASPTAYLDWESTEEEVAARVDGICRGLGVTLPAGAILYRPMFRALADEASRLRADFARHGVEVVTVDSFGPACGAEPESADSAIRTMNALRSFAGTTRLVLAHISKAAADQPSGATRPYGSVFVRNLARSAWELRRAEEADPDELVIAAYQRKNNAGRRAPPFSLRLTFQPDGAVVVTGADLAEAPDLLARASLSKRAMVALATGALTIAELSEHLDAAEATMGRIVQRLATKGARAVGARRGEPACVRMLKSIGLDRSGALELDDDDEAGPLLALADDDHEPAKGDDRIYAALDADDVRGAVTDALKEIVNMEVRGAIQYLRGRVD